MGDAFGLNHQELAVGAGGLNGLVGQAGELVGQVRQALAGAADAAGSADLTTALMEIDVLHARRMAEFGALYGHIGESLGQTAKGYQGADSGAAARIEASGKRPS